MESLTLIGTVLAIHIFAWLTPGPNFVLIIRNSLVYSRKSGLWTAVGIAMSNFIHISYSLLLIIFISETSTIALTILKFFGASYLAYLGIKTLLIKSQTQNDTIDNQKHKDLSPIKAIKIGFLTNILSPKAPPFFISIFGGIIASATPLWVIIFLWFAMPINSFIMASLFSVFFTHKKIRTVYMKYQPIVNKLLGIALLTLAVMIAMHK